jgi:ferredoxin
MKIRVDSEKCMGHGMCTTFAPGVFHVNDDSGYNEMGEFEISPEQLPAAQRGAAACPEQAISLLDDAAV